jgi:hypothetical protein
MTPKTKKYSKKVCLPSLVSGQLETSLNKSLELAGHLKSNKNFQKMFVSGN